MGMRHGIYYALNDNEYREDPALSVSGLKSFSLSPLHYQNALTQVRKKTPALIFGSAFHARVLEPEVYAERYVSKFINLKTVAGREERDALESLGKVFLSEEDAKTVEDMALSVEGHSLGSILFGGGKPEVSFFWSDASGIRSKARADYWREDIAGIVDLKTCENASEREVMRSVAQYKYHWQAAYYRAGVANVLGVDRQSVTFTFVFIEKSAPYGISVYTVPEQIFELAESQYRPLIESYKQCLETNNWPCYEPEIKTLSLPAWAMN